MNEKQVDRLYRRAWRRSRIKPRRCRWWVRRHRWEMVGDMARCTRCGTRHVLSNFSLAWGQLSESAIKRWRDVDLDEFQREHRTDE